VAPNNLPPSKAKFILPIISVAGVWKKFKYCSQCNLIMVERAKWKNFDEVKYCSDKCRKHAQRGDGGGGAIGKSKKPIPDSRKRDDK